MRANEHVLETPAMTIDQALQHPVEIAWNPAQALAGGIYGFDSIDPRSRSFNLIRGRLLELKRSRGWRLIGVVSATPNVGKSFVSANIGASLSRDPQTKAFVVDLDLRRGSLSAQFGVEPASGLSEFLQSDRPLETWRLEGQNLTIVPTHGGMVHSAELLAGSRAKALFKAMRDSDPASIFICDLPPVFANDDALATVANLDGYILVAEEGKTTERELKDSIDALGHERLAGVTLNKFRGGVLSDGYGVDSYYARGYGRDINDG
jgi:protein-tyrosine kinase